MSRGAGHTTFVEKSTVASRALESNVKVLEASNAQVVSGDARKFVEGYSGEPIDIIFLDPPFAEDMLGDLCRLLAEGDALADEALVYLEMDTKQALPAMPDGWSTIKDKKAGNVRYLLVRVTRNEE